MTAGGEPGAQDAIALSLALVLGLDRGQEGGRWGAIRNNDSNTDQGEEGEQHNEKKPFSAA